MAAAAALVSPRELVDSHSERSESPLEPAPHVVAAAGSLTTPDSLAPTTTTEDVQAGPVPTDGAGSPLTLAVQQSSAQVHTAREERVPWMLNSGMTFCVDVSLFLSLHACVCLECFHAWCVEMSDPFGTWWNAQSPHTTEYHVSSETLGCGGKIRIMRPSAIKLQPYAARPGAASCKLAELLLSETAAPQATAPHATAATASAAADLVYDGQSGEERSIDPECAGHNRTTSTNVILRKLATTARNIWKRGLLGLTDGSSFHLGVELLSPIGENSVPMDLDACETFIAAYSGMAIQIYLNGQSPPAWHMLHHMWAAYDFDRFVDILRTHVIKWPQYSLYENNNMFNVTSVNSSRLPNLLLEGTQMILNILTDRISAELRKPNVNLISVRNVIQSLITDFLRAGLFFTCVPLLLFVSLNQLTLVKNDSHYIFARPAKNLNGWMAPNALDNGLGFIDMCQGGRNNESHVRKRDQIQATAIRRGIDVYQSLT